MATPSSKKAHMEVQRALIDKDFDRYVLASGGVEKQLLTLPSPVLEPLAAAHTVRKAQWDARVHYNALVADPFVSESSSATGDSDKSIAYYISADHELMQVIFSKSEGVRVQKLFQLPLGTSREENASLQVAGRGLLLYSDGHGAFLFLQAERDPLDAAAWRLLYKCNPLGQTATLLLGASFDEVAQRFHVLATELIEYNDKDAVYRLHVVDVFSSAAVVDAMAVDAGSVSGAVGLQHTATELAVLSSLPSFVSFAGSELQVLVEGKYELAVELLAPPPAAASVVSDSTATEHAPTLHKRHHDDDADVDDAALDEVLAKLPRAGIGYHGDISDIKHAQELALDMSTPLEARFQKSSTPYSTLDEPLHSAPDAASRSATAAAREGKLEVPTTESILGGFEECDDVDPNATAALLRVRLSSGAGTSGVAVREQREINCRAFRFLCASAQLPQRAPTLLFQHDVHALVFASNNAAATDAPLTHSATLPAFGFVQASKQQKKFLAVHPGGAFACIGEFEKRVFVYHGAARDADEDASHTRRQHVVELGDHQLLGLRVAGDRAVLVLMPHHVVALSW